MGWEHRKGQKSIWHEHTMLKYKKPRHYLPDVVTKEEWGALPPWEEPDSLRHPVNHINFVYTETETCSNLKDCMKVVQNVQKEHIEMGMDDIGYNFLIGGDGRKYEGRGWLLRPEKPGKTVKKRRQTIDIAYIGNEFHYRTGTKNPPIMMEARQDLVHYGVTNNFIHCCYYVRHDIFEPVDYKRE